MESRGRAFNRYMRHIVSAMAAALLTVSLCVSAMAAEKFGSRFRSCRG